MKIINKKSFYYGIILSLALVFIYTFSEEIGFVTKGPSFQFWPWHLRALSFIPGGLLIFHGLFPKTTIGRAGGIIFSVYSWVRRQNKK